MSTASIWVGAILLGVIVLAHHDLFHAELGVASRLTSLVDRVVRPLRARTSETTTTEHLLFLAGLVIGGFAVAATTRTFAINPGVASTQFSSVFDGRIDAAVALFVGGLFVGAGMRLAAPALGAHGLLSLSRLDRGTVVATLVFVASAVVLSFAFEAFR